MTRTPMPRPARIVLTPEEEALFQKLPQASDPMGQTKDAMDAQAGLFRGLYERQAIPQKRLACFFDKDLNPGKKLSHRDVFIRNGCTDDTIPLHGHFTKYLRGFITGPSLPTETIEGFCDYLDGCGLFTSGDLEPLCQYARQETRRHSLLPRNAAEEFFKLAVECELNESDAKSIRSYVMATKL